MGEEYAETSPFLYFTNHGDKELIKLVREGRKREFQAFVTEEEPPDPDDTETFLSSKLNWTRQNKQQQQMYGFYRELIRLRKSLAPLKSTDRTNCSATAVNNKNLIILSRNYQDEKLLFFFNFEKNPVEFSFTAPRKASWQLQLNSAGTQWGGTGEKPEIFNNSRAEVPGYSVSVWTS